MPGFDHHAAPPEPPDTATQARNARYGLALFFLYLAVYAGFVLLNAFAPTPAPSFTSPSRMCSVPM